MDRYLISKMCHRGVECQIRQLKWIGDYGYGVNYGYELH